MAQLVPHAGCNFGDEDGREDSIPEPVYFKLESLQLPSSDLEQEYTDSESSIDGDDIELDLFAPPHDS